MVDGWGEEFFAVNEAGHIVVRPDHTSDREVDLYDIIQGLTDRGLHAPVLINFVDLLDRRIADMHDAFNDAIATYDYGGQYRAVYPIKVNQQRHLVEQVKQCGKRFGYGLEVGSKPELLAVLGMTVGESERLIICNGFKEGRYIRHAMLATKLGRTIIPVIENSSELKLIIDEAEAFGVRPRIGVRINLSQKGVGRWRTSSGEKAKFGLSLPAVLDVMRQLREHDMLDCLQLVHCHIGSQTNDIQVINAAVNELSRIYVEMVRLGAGLRYLDIGGGLGIDYDGSQTNTDYSVNYSLREYAGTVVYRVMSVCDEAEVPHPTIVTESGRAMVSHQGVLVFNVLGANRVDRFQVNEAFIEQTNGDRDDWPRPVHDLYDAYKRLNDEHLLEAYHDAILSRDEALMLFSLGHLALEHRAIVDRLFWSVCLKAYEVAQTLEELPDELAGLSVNLSDTYFCNLSIFQSLPDNWAIDQVFPIMPIHRLDEEPTRRATLADLTCDSDGKITRFINRREAYSPTLQVHDLIPGADYYLGAFLVGAYQETLGDLHNLFGDTHVVHIRFDEDGQWAIDQVVEGDSVREVLSYVQYDVPALSEAVRRDCESSVRAGKMTAAESRTMLEAYEQGLAGYTYLEE
ncbi:MAG: biosynthetic arginine decarboxylase [Phycisphaera sp.]|nr:biosynthetic arginine decarboxylase [Phycisphaera sp.]